MTREEVIKDMTQMFQAAVKEAYQDLIDKAVAAEREAVLDLVDAYAKNNTDLAAAIRARGEK